ncbi:MAG: PAS domain S-box protein [Ktedonobacteraceae bacterium]|nr:PAS domain S-box protein [Ktedonobacteraceae bacterium]
MTATPKKAYMGSEDEETYGQNEQRSHSFIENSSDIMVLLNAENIVTYVSPSITPVLRCTPEEIVGSHVSTLLHFDDVDRLRQVLSEVGQVPGKSLSAQYRLRCKDGSWEWFEGSVTNLLSVPGAGSIIATFRATPEQKSALYVKQSQMSGSEHFVQFYESDEFLLDAVSEFVNAGLVEGDTCIVIARKALREGLEKRLQANELNQVVALVRGECILQDAAETLSKFMVDGLLDPKRFAEVVGSIIAQAAQGGRRVRIFGEMVALLWSEGNQNAAIQLEKLWNDLHNTSYPFSLFCAYSMHSFARDTYKEQFSEICKQHSLVIPGESYTSLRRLDESLQAIALLQQKANALEVETAERQRREETVLHLATIVETSDDAILSKDLDGIITSWNAAAERMYGYSAQEIVGRSVTTIFLPGRRDEFEQIMARIRRGEHVDHFETIRRRKDGILLNVSVTISPIKNSAGTIIGASTIARNITEQKRLEAKSQRLFDSNLIGVFVSDFSGTFLDANDAFLNLIGYTRAELQAGSVERDSITPPEFHPLSQIAVNKLQEVGSSDTYEKEYLHKSGKRIPVLVAVTRIDQISDTCIGFVLDISERKELEKRKDEFISMASHELKTPVTSLKGFLSLLQRRLVAQGDEKALHYLTRMDNQINKLIKLINDLLDLSKMQTGQLIYREERFEVDDLVQEIVENVQETTQTHHLQLEGQAHAVVFGDRDRIGQVLINLLNNAIKYSHQADKVLVHIAKEQDEVHISVQDFGIGIAEEHQHRIFERFYQVADSEEQTYPGLGIGLYISCEIVKRHGGKMWVESKKGLGSTFHFTLPLVED